MSLQYGSLFSGSGNGDSGSTDVESMALFQDQESALQFDAGLSSGAAAHSASFTLERAEPMDVDDGAKLPFGARQPLQFDDVQRPAAPAPLPMGDNAPVPSAGKQDTAPSLEQAPNDASAGGKDGARLDLPGSLPAAGQPAKRGPTERRVDELDTPDVDMPATTATPDTPSLASDASPRPASSGATAEMAKMALVPSTASNTPTALGGPALGKPLLPTGPRLAASKPRISLLNRPSLGARPLERPKLGPSPLGANAAGASPKGSAHKTTSNFQLLTPPAPVATATAAAASDGGRARERLSPSAFSPRTPTSAEGRNGAGPLLSARPQARPALSPASLASAATTPDASAAKTSASAEADFHISNPDMLRFAHEQVLALHKMKQVLDKLQLSFAQQGHHLLLVGHSPELEYGISLME